MLFSNSWRRSYKKKHEGQKQAKKVQGKEKQSKESFVSVSDTSIIQFVTEDELSNYNVEVGRFGLKVNAVTLSERLKNQGYNPKIYLDKIKNMYSVIFGFSDRQAAIQCRDKMRERFPSACVWYLDNSIITRVD